MSLIMLPYLVFTFIYIFSIDANENSGVCSINEQDGNFDDCLVHGLDESNSFRYLLYDVNAPEGFNLRRDVYMRMAVFIHNLQKLKNEKLNRFKLVLPPWHELYHWRRNKNNKHVAWSRFFDLPSLNKFASVIEMHQFFDDVGSNFKKVVLDEVYHLQHFESMFETGKFEEKMLIENCTNEIDLNFYEYMNLTSNNIKCVSFHGHTSQMAKILENTLSKTILFNRAEIALHDHYGDQLYWKARRSMRFNKNLRAIANAYRRKYLNSTDKEDNTIVPDDWMTERPHRNATGGLYMCVHLRRRDFLWGRPTEIPSIVNATEQIIALLHKYNLHKVFIATDAPEKEYEELKDRMFEKYSVYKYDPEEEYLDGEKAIIEQIICSHAFYFVGTHESTFSFRIQEEREILGIPPERTFNRLCGGSALNCENPSVWKITF